MTSLASKTPAWHRHVEGWQLAVVTVGMALTAAALALPRPAVPHELPVPVVDRRQLGRLAAERRALAERARRSPLSFRVRAVGEGFRRLGAAEAKDDPTAAAARRKDIEARTREAREREGDEPLLALRAVQTELFVRAVREYLATGKENADVRELGGTFLRRAAESGWIGPGRRLNLDEDALAGLFAVRWTRLAGLVSTHPFSPTLDEWRLYYRTLLEAPELGPGSAPSRDPLAHPEITRAIVTSLAKMDPDYPALLARGILELRAERWESAATLLSQYLREHPAGPWRLRAQNYLARAYQATPLGS